MSQIHSMSDDQVASELKKMTAFIRQEALEKAREIQIKADEEFAIEKSKLVRAETSSIDNAYDKKFKQASMSQQITRSKVGNKSRLKILGAKQEMLDDLFERAREQLVEYSKQGEEYQGVLQGLILEGLYAMNEERLSIRARKADYEMVKKAISDAQKKYKDELKKDVKVEIDEKNPLPEDSSGGVVIVGGNGKIDITNTFGERLKILQLEALPQIRLQLFGENENRKFKE